MYVSNSSEDWPHEREATQRSIPDVYVLNNDMPYFSEYGSIDIDIASGVAERL